MSEQIHYRLLSEGEIIQEGDEYFGCRGKWELFELGNGDANYLDLPLRRPYTPFQWIPVEERLPTEKDGDFRGEVLVLLGKRGCGSWSWDSLSNEDEVIAWAKIPPYTPAVSPEEKEFQVWYSQNSSEPTNSPAWKLAKDAWMAAKKGGKA